uniref:SCP domain-containing protein n=1 Tax=Steinernema glaseri TaxID=37863 RepID=A0A1I7ZID4_9BILA
MRCCENCATSHSIQFRYFDKAPGKGARAKRVNNGSAQGPFCDEDGLCNVGHNPSGITTWMYQTSKNMSSHQ